MSCYAVVDLEMCNVPSNFRNNKYHFSMETIQIGAVLLNESLEIVDQFVTYVSPEFGFISSFIRRLTGISKHDVSGAPNMEEALQRFANWLPEDATVVSWSDNDKTQILHEMKGKDIHIERIDRLFEGWIDCQKVFSEKLNSPKCYNLEEALNIANIIYKDGAHDGQVDAYNTALLFAKMENEEKLQLNPYYSRMFCLEEDSSGFTLGSLFAGMDLQRIISA